MDRATSVNPTGPVSRSFPDSYQVYRMGDSRSPFCDVFANQTEELHAGIPSLSMTSAQLMRLIFETDPLEVTPTMGSLTISWQGSREIQIQPQGERYAIVRD